MPRPPLIAHDVAYDVAASIVVTAEDAPRTASHSCVAPSYCAGVLPCYADALHGIELHCGDALALLQSVQADTFDLIFADPPYFLSNDGVTCHAGSA